MRSASIGMLPRPSAPVQGDINLSNVTGLMRARGRLGGRPAIYPLAPAFCIVLRRLDLSLPPEHRALAGVLGARRVLPVEEAGAVQRGPEPRRHHGL